MLNPADLRLGTASGGGTSIQSTWPERSADSRVVASGIGNTTILSSFGTRVLSQYPSLRASVALTRGLNSTILNGPVPAGAFANSAHDPVFLNCAGLTLSIQVTMFGK